MAFIGDETAGCVPAQFNSGCAVCEKCNEIDLLIAHYKRLESEATDKVFLAGVAEVLKNYLADKVALHPEEK